MNISEIYYPADLQFLDVTGTYKGTDDDVDQATRDWLVSNTCKTSPPTFETISFEINGEASELERETYQLISLHSESPVEVNLVSLIGNSDKRLCTMVYEEKGRKRYVDDLGLHPDVPSAFAAALGRLIATEREITDGIF